MIYCLVGASANGKTSILKRSGMSSFVSYTTREQRNDEVDGVDYYFISNDKFLEMEKNGCFVETTKYASSLYGISKAEVERNKDNDIIVAVDINGYRQFKDIYKANVVGIYVDCNIFVSIARMFKRKDSIKNIFKRIAHRVIKNESIAKFEMPFIIDNSDTIETSMLQFKNLTYKNLVLLLEDIPKLKKFNVEVLITYLETSGYNIVNKEDIATFLTKNRSIKTYEFYSIKQLLKNIDRAKYVLNINGSNNEIISTIAKMNNMTELNLDYDEDLYNAINAIYNSEKS